MANTPREVTLVTKDSYGHLHVRLAILEKEGRVYLHVHYVHFVDGKREDYGWIDQVRRDSTSVLEGFDIEHLQAFKDLLKARESRETERRKLYAQTRYDFEHEAYRKLNEVMKTWETEHPYPPVPDILSTLEIGPEPLYPTQPA